MFLEEDVKNQLSLCIANKIGRSFIIKTMKPIGGGCINDCFLITDGEISYFLKINNAHKYPKMFYKETKGLELLRQNSSLTVPQAIIETQIEDYAFLVLEYIKSGVKKKTFWEHFGQNLAEQHKISNIEYGLDHDNYIGSLPQINTWNKSWADFFIINRIEYQVKIAYENKLLENNYIKTLDKIHKTIDNEFPKSKPSVLHGDLWSGNFMVNEMGNPVLVDPAFYYGDREVEMAFTTMFGGFDGAFYDAYNSEFPLEPNYKARFELYNLYPTLVHVNLFGGGYIQQAISILKRWN